MKVYGLTGGIGSGKTTVRQLFEDEGVPTLDADQIAREVVAKNQPGLAEIERTFGSDYLTNGELNRAKLRELIFNDASAKQALEAILHPLIRQRTEQLIQQLKKQHPPAIVVEIPLLTETGKPNYVDEVIVLDLAPETQLKRAITRDQLPAEDIQKIIQQQATRAERLAVADIILNTEQPLETLRKDIQSLLHTHQNT
ncbi:MAG: dephospho-CoA kinase [Hydrogenovibrio crunogenus]|uniref:Dephospho-CoA kinase n=1 Tax=Hydrogenovibrio crunogenus (strain DSM 25203 / XCL-2) TaxID=317025 RepID=COAE_HYDCU|nr:RecName: Full=Dephospho-CoA kinase; AltName: Full=Dephosphocoenzyme A kinase [Hydrogenovibrio crunogenus XCL-2]MBD3612817.1 dephospho-CoA kinase [Hydrogenovibrio crunogenus]